MQGTIRSANGHLGAFELTVDDYAQPAPSSRGQLSFAAPRNGAVSRCDLILDISGGPALFAAADLRDGYLRADPADPAAVLRAGLQARDLTGTFDKPRYIDFTADITFDRVTFHYAGHVTPPIALGHHQGGRYVGIGAYICAGCGGRAVCPTGAAAYALPPADALIRKLRALLTAYREAGGTRPVVLVQTARTARRHRCSRALRGRIAANAAAGGK